MADKVLAGQVQQATPQAVVGITTHQVSKSTNKKVITMSKNTKPRPQYPKNKPSMQPLEKSGKGRSNKQTSK